MTHKHYELFKAAALGNADKFEAHMVNWLDGKYDLATPHFFSIYNHPHDWIIRRKEQTHVVNGFIVPKPMDQEPQFGTVYWVECSAQEGWAYEIWWTGSHAVDMRNLERGNAHATEAGAAANCKARYGVEP